ncbi:hypothetical protein EYF80_002970 [Liparis tanakae]|uniref:Uncharacterized protein n=1 Tax=Liparis tanakae TaxID=230148 RepID=A0A4Z2J9R4_9TELE|nr:hypothetical protein EYF80_002970 [Liparis tanakae]
MKHLDASSLFVQLLFLVFHLGLKVTKLLLDFGQRGFILRLLGREILQLYLQLLHLYICGAQFNVLVLRAEDIRLSLVLLQIMVATVQALQVKLSVLQLCRQFLALLLQLLHRALNILIIRLQISHLQLRFLLLYLLLGLAAPGIPYRRPGTGLAKVLALKNN